MNDQKWFSARLRFVVLVDPVGGDTLYDRIFLLKAEDFDSAFARAITLGRSQETEFKNNDNDRVLWRFMNIISIDIVLADDLDGAELLSEYKANPAGIMRFDQIFEPEKSKPVQTI